MGRLITNSPKPVVRVKVAQTNYRAIQNLAQSVHNLMLANVGTFVSPLPTMINFQNDIDALKSAIAFIGTKFNKGSHSDLNACKNAAFIVFNDLTSLAMYVQVLVDGSSSAAYQRVLISLSGFATKSPKSRIPKMQFVRNVHQSNNKQFPVSLRRVAWRRSLGLFNGVRAKSYNIYGRAAGSTSDVFLTSTTKTNYIVPSTLLVAGISTPLDSVIIKPVSPTGEGNGFQINVKG